MAAVQLNQDVVIYPKGRAAGDQPFAAFISGVAWRGDLGVGDGPIIPPDQPPGGGGPGPDDPHPEHPIVLPPEPPIPPIDSLPNPVPPNAVLKEAAEGGWGLYSKADSSVYWAFNPAPSGAGPKR